ELVGRDGGLPDGPAALVDLCALAPGGDVPGAVVAQFRRLRGGALGGAGRLLVATARGGDFALGDGGPGPLDLATAGAAAAGMVRTFAHELPDVRSQVV